MASPRIRSRDQLGHGVLVDEPMSRLIDEMLERYVEWREDAAAVAEAYERWSGANPGEEAWRFSAYHAALEQEESAANSYAAVVAEIDRSLLQAPLGPS